MDNELIEALKKMLAGEAPTLPQADDGDVIAKVVPTYRPETRRVEIEVVLEARPGVKIENYGTGLAYQAGGGKGTPGTLHTARSWGVASGPTIEAAVDIGVAQSGSHAASWRVGTLIETNSGYRLWSQAGSFEFKA